MFIATPDEMMKKRHFAKTVLVLFMSAAAVEGRGDAVGSAATRSAKTDGSARNDVMVVDGQRFANTHHKAHVYLEPQRYLTLGQIALSDVIPNGSAEKISVSVVDGPDFLMKIGSDGVFRYLAPEEQYKDTITTLEFKEAGKDFQHQVSMAWSSDITSSISQISEGEHGETASLILLIDGVGSIDGHVHEKTASMTYMLHAPEPLSKAHCEISIENKTASFDVTHWFDINAEAGTLALKKAYVQQLKETLKESGIFMLVFSLSTKNYELTYGFESQLQYAGGSLTVEFVDPQGEPDYATVGDQYIVTGFDSGLKVLATVNDRGQLLVDNLPVDTYALEEVLLEPGTPLVGFYRFDGRKTDAMLTISTRQRH